MEQGPVRQGSKNNLAAESTETRALTVWRWAGQVFFPDLCSSPAQQEG